MKVLDVNEKTHIDEYLNAQIYIEELVYDYLSGNGSWNAPYTEEIENAINCSHYRIQALKSIRSKLNGKTRNKGII